MIYVLEFIAIIALLAGYSYNAKTGNITAWEEETLALYKDDFQYYKTKIWKWLTRRVNRMIRAYERAHQEVRR